MEKESNRDGQDEGKSKKAKGETESSLLPSLTFTFCLFTFAFILSILSIPVRFCFDKPGDSLLRGNIKRVTQVLASGYEPKRLF
jgi:hypothetical protein